MAIYTLTDLLEQRFVSAEKFGWEKLNDSIMAHMEWLNQQVNDQVSLFAEVSEDQRRVWGGNAAFEMKEQDEFAVSRAEKAVMGTETAYPLRKMSVSTGFTADWLRRATVAEVATNTIGFQNAYLERLQKELTFGIFNKDNYNFVDKFGNGTTLAVKAFINADSSDIPDSDDGVSFDGTSHTHFAGTAAFAYGDIDTLIANVTQHGSQYKKGVALFINAGNIATLVALASTKFLKLTSAVIAPASTSDSTIARINPETDLNNALVGYWDGRIPVYTKAWMPSGYYCVMATGHPQKGLVLRQDSYVKGLALLPEYGQMNIFAKTAEAYVGMGSYNRLAVAVLDSGHAAYNEPSGLIR